MNFRILTDSCCDLSYKVFEQEDVHVIPMVVTLEGKEYIDDSGKTFDSRKLIEEIKKEKEVSTSQVNIGTYLKTFQSLMKESDVPVIYICFSSGLSGSFNNAQAALAMIKEEQPAAPIYLIDSKQACLGEGLLVAELIKLRKEGLSLEQAIARINNLRERVQSWVTVDDLKHLERGGRVSKASAAVGTLINIKPILMMTEEGKLVNQAKVRGRKKSLDKLAKNTRENISVEDTTTIYIAYAGDLEAAEYIESQLIDLGVPIEVLPMGATISCHTGYGALAVFSIVK